MSPIPDPAAVRDHLERALAMMGSGPRDLIYLSPRQMMRLLPGPMPDEPRRRRLMQKLRKDRSLRRRLDGNQEHVEVGDWLRAISRLGPDDAAGAVVELPAEHYRLGLQLAKSRGTSIEGLLEDLIEAAAAEARRAAPRR